MSALFLAGCGSELAPLTGTVSLNGKPLTGAAGAVTFASTTGGPNGAGSLNADGTFSVTTGALKGLPPGDYEVGVSASMPVVSASRDKPPEIPKSLIPAKYADPKTSGLRFTIKPGQRTQDIALTDQ